MAFILKSLSKGNIFLFIQAMDGLDRNLAHSYEITSESRIHDELRGFFDSIYLNDHVSLREKVKQTVLDQVEETPSSSTSNTKRIRKDPTWLRDYHLGTSQRKKKPDETQKNGACKFSKSFTINTEFLNQDDLSLQSMTIIIRKNEIIYEGASFAQLFFHSKHL